MPIYHKTPPSSAVGNHNTAEIDYHTSEAAKVKRTREQAYFNSYDFDAIEVLPYDDDDEEEEEDVEGGVKAREKDKERKQLKSIQARQQQQKPAIQKLTHHSHQQKQQKPSSNHSSKAVSLNCKSFVIDNRQQQHHAPHHASRKSNTAMYMKCITSFFASIPNKSHKSQQQQQCNNKTISTLSHNNKHLKASSSKTSSIPLASSSIVAGILNVIDHNDGDNENDDDDDVVTGSGLLPLEYCRDVIGTGTTRTNVTSNMNFQTVGVPTVCASTATAAAAVTSTNAVSSGGNFLLPRAMLKYQSSTLLNTQQGAAGITAGNTNSMPLATNASSVSRNNNGVTNKKQKQQQQQQQPQQQQQQRKILINPAKDVHKLVTNKGSNEMMPTAGSNTRQRLKKTSSRSSIITSLASEEIEEERDLEVNGDQHNGQVKTEEKLSPKNININNKTSARASPHQSNYSTDKSASSGYYSSHLCSTYSLEEHIYSEPTLDIKKLSNNAQETKQTASPSSAATATPSAANTLQTSNKLQQHQHQQQQLTGSLLPMTGETKSALRSLDKCGAFRFPNTDLPTLSTNRNSQEFNENLKILESSIENLDRHLKSFPGVTSQEVLVNYTPNAYTAYASINHNDKIRSSSSYHQLPTIQESFDAVKKQSWPEDRSDDSLMDIDLDSFLLDKDSKTERKSKATANDKGMENPTFLTEEQEENHYKCAKYINSCPEDAYRVDSDIMAPARSSISGQSLAVSVDLYPKRYEEQLHFQNTRELLEDVRDKIRLLTRTQETESQQAPASTAQETEKVDKETQLPKELHTMINTLKHELELYLNRMNQHSELEIRQLCTGLVKNQHIVKMKNAFERRRSLSETPDIYSTYETVQDGLTMKAQAVPFSIRQEITSIRCTSDPNFKMKRKSITEVFPLNGCCMDSLETVHNTNTSIPPNTTTQLQRNLSYHKPVLEPLNATNTSNAANPKPNTTSSGSGNASNGDTSEPNDKDSILEWHRKKPSIWEMYYGTNRIQQSLLGIKKNGMMVTTATASSPSTMCYPSSRPESDFTLDLPRAEQLRIKMEKEKKFRQRCRVITTFLSLVFFLLTVMVVSLVLTRGKRMFGSMI